MLTGFASASRRSEQQADGLLLHISRSKTDENDAGHVVAIPRAGKLQTFEALPNWLDLVSITTTTTEEAEELRAIGQAECEASEQLDSPGEARSRPASGESPFVVM